MRGVVSALAGLLLAGGALAADGTASGSFRFGGSELAVERAYAFWVAEETPQARRAIVLLTDRPIDAEAAAVALDPSAAAREELDAAAGGLVEIAVTAEGEAASIAFWQADPPAAFTAVPAGSFELTVFGEERIAGSWQLAPGAAAESAEASFSLLFDSPISEAPVRGKVLPAGGGEPGEAYLAYAAALRAGDVEVLRRLLGERAEEALPRDADAATLGVLVSLLRGGRPLEPAVTAGLLRGGTAILWVEGRDDEGTRLRGRVLMAKTPQGWREAESDLAPAL